MPRRISDYDSNFFANQTPGKLGLKLLGVFVAVGVILMVVGLGLGWFRAGTDIISPENVKKQWQFAYDYNASLEGLSSQWCTLTKAENAETTPEFKVQRTNQRIAVEQQYDRVRAEYNGRLADAFRAGLVKPPDVPEVALTLAQNVQKLQLVCT